MGVVDRVALSADVLSRAVIHVLSLVPGEGGRTEPLTPVLATVLEEVPGQWLSPAPGRHRCKSFLDENVLILSPLNYLTFNID